eukprot:2609811-Heterocapsa_arctica.AAC.1
MEVDSDYICAAQSPTPWPDRIRSVKAHGVDDPIPVAIYHDRTMINTLWWVAQTMIDALNPKP